MELNTAIEKLEHWMRIEPHPGSAYAMAMQTVIAGFRAQEQVVNDAHATAATAKRQLAELQRKCENLLQWMLYKKWLTIKDVDGDTRAEIAEAVRSLSVEKLRGVVGINLIAAEKEVHKLLIVESEPPEDTDDMPRNQIIHGDSLVKMLGRRAESVDLVFADPPFNIGYGYDTYSDNRPTWDYVEWSRVWINHAARLIKPGGALWLAIGDKHVSQLDVYLNGDHAPHGLSRRAWVIWSYTFGQNQQKNFGKCHTHLLYYTKGRPKTFNANTIRVPSDRQTKYNDKRAHPDGKIPDDVWQFSRICGTFKERAKDYPLGTEELPPQMPEAILERIISACSNRGDLVLDPFLGSGTTAVVAKRLDRRYLGIELSEAYCEGARKRVAKVRRGEGLSREETSNG